MTDNAPSAVLVVRPTRVPTTRGAGRTGTPRTGGTKADSTKARGTDDTTEAAHIALGRRGEELAARYLDSIGIVVLSRNWRCEDGELDIVGTDRDRLIVCEVKTRSGTHYGPPAGAVTDEKACRIRRLAARWRALHGVAGCDTRFDIVSVLWPPGERPTVEHLKAAF